MALIDRIQEFRTFAAHAANESDTSRQQPLRHAGIGDTQQVFGDAVRELSKDIHVTSLKLKRMTQLVRQRNMINSSQQEVSTLTSSIKDDITFLNERLDKLQLLAAQQTTSTGTQHSSHSAVIVNGLKSQLLDATQTFRNVLKDRTTSMKNTTERKAQYGTSRDLGKPLVYRSNRRTTLRAAAAQPDETTSLMQSCPQSNNSQDSNELDVGTTERGNGSTGHAFEHVSLQIQEDRSDSYLRSRADDVSAIESHIHELGNIFQRLATMVSEQSHMVSRLDDNVDQMLENIELGQSQLERRYAVVSDNRILALKILAVLMIFAVFFTVFVA